VILLLLVHCNRPFLGPVDDVLYQLFGSMR
jgi:hypothetical protein